MWFCDIFYIVGFRTGLAVLQELTGSYLTRVGRIGSHLTRFGLMGVWGGRGQWSTICILFTQNVNGVKHVFCVPYFLTVPIGQTNLPILVLV